MDIKDFFVSYKAITPEDVPDMQPVPTIDNSVHELIAKMQTRHSKQKKETPQEETIKWVQSETPEDNVATTTPSTTPSSTTSSFSSASIKNSNSPGFASFNQAYDEYLREHPEDNDPEMRYILSNIAGHESGFKNSAQNPTSSAFGYFQMIDSTRKSYSKLSKEEFKNSPKEQIAAAIRLYKNIDSTYISRNQQALQARGVDKAHAMYGYWFRPASMQNYLKSGADGYKDPQGTNLEKVWATYHKLGGILYGKSFS